jgi:hypothetical protein
VSERATERADQNATIGCPCTSHHPGYVANCKCRPGSHIDALQLAAGEESDGSPVRRPKRLTGVLGAGLGAGLRVVKRSKPQCGLAIHACAKDGCPAVGREDQTQTSAYVAEDFESAAIGRRDLETQHRCCGIRLANARYEQKAKNRYNPLQSPQRTFSRVAGAAAPDRSNRA